MIRARGRGHVAAALSLMVIAGALAAMPAASPGAARRVAATPKLKSTKGAIDAVGMDGPVVAYSVQGTSTGPTRCNRIFLWNVATGGGVVAKAPRTCDANSTSTGGGVTAIAVAGKRLAWLVNTGGNTETSDALFTARWANGRVPVEKRIAAATSVGDVDCVLTGPRIGGLVGDGTVLAFNAWRTEAATPGDPGSCATKRTTGALRLIGAYRATTVATGTATVTARSASAGRIAVVRDDATVALYGANGVLQRTLAPGTVHEVALSAGVLAVLTAPKTLELFDAATGAALETIPVAAGAAHLDLEGGVAVYAAGRTLHAVAIGSGKDVVVATAPRRIEGVEIEKPGAVYVFNRVSGVNGRGSLGFIPTAALAARLG